LQATVQSIALIVEAKDPYTSGHQERVSPLAEAIAKEMGLTADQQDFISTAAIIHDLGKISIPSEILSKPTKLSELEFNLIKIHSMSGYNILRDIDFPWPVADIILQHHERMDGSGYPQHLQERLFFWRRGFWLLPTSWRPYLLTVPIVPPWELVLLWMRFPRIKASFMMQMLSMPAGNYFVRKISSLVKKCLRLFPSLLEIQIFLR